MAPPLRARRSAAARRLGGARCHDRAGRGARRPLGSSRAREPTGWWQEIPYRSTICTRTRGSASSACASSASGSASSATRRRRSRRGRASRAPGGRRSSSSASLGVAQARSRVLPRVAELMGRRRRRARVRRRPRGQRRPPAAAAGLVAVHVRRGPWGRLQRTPPEAALGLDDLASLPDALASLAELRVGIGFDAHALEEGVPLVLGGVPIEHPRGLAGHSDGDVVAHALIDAAPRSREPRRHRLALPVRTTSGTAERRRSTCSGRPTREVREAGLGARERRLRPRRGGAAYRRRTATRWEAARRRARRRAELVAVRATTTDGLGFTGRGEGLAAQAVALLER